MARTSKASTKKAGNVVDIDFEDYEPPRSEYMGEEPQKGVYRFRLVSLQKHKADSGNESIHWMFELTDEPYAGWTGHMYTGLPGSESFFRTQHTVRALQGGKEKKVSLDLDNPEKFIKSCKIVLGRIVMEEYNGDMRAKLRTVAPDDASVKSTKPIVEDDEDDEFEEDLDEDDDIDEDEDDTEEDDFDDEDDEESDDDEEDDEEDDDEDEEEDEEDEDDEEEEPEPEPAPKRRKASPSTKKKAPAKKVPAKRKSR